MQELRLEARIIRYRRERWQTADGKALIAPLPAGLRGHFGHELVRFILLRHHQARDTFLSLLKTCQELSVPFFDCLGNRLGVVGAPHITPLPDLVLAAKT